MDRTGGYVSSKKRNLLINPMMLHENQKNHSDKKGKERK